MKHHLLISFVCLSFLAYPLKAQMPKYNCEGVPDNQNEIQNIEFTPNPDNAGDSNFPPEVTLTPVSIPNVPRPEYLIQVTDPTFTTKITRITDDKVFGRTNSRHHYSKVNPWNADNTRIFVWPNHMIDAATYKYLGPFNAPSDYRWSNINPDIIYGTTGSSFQKIVVSTNIRSSLMTFPYDECWFGNHEGNLSNDDKYALISCRDGSDAVLILYDLELNTVYSSKVFIRKWSQLDWASVSQLGNYIVVAWSDIGTYSYDLDFNPIVQLFKGTPHGDVCIDTAGNEVFVMLPLRMIRLDTGEPIVLSSAHFGGHVSCRNIARPGWAYISTYEPYYEVFAIKLDSSGIIQRFAHHHSDYKLGYDHQPQAAVNNNGTMVMFHSNWGLNNGRDSILYPSNSFVTETLYSDKSAGNSD